MELMDQGLECQAQERISKESPVTKMYLMQWDSLWLESLRVAASGSDVAGRCIEEISWQCDLWVFGYHENCWSCTIEVQFDQYKEGCGGLVPHLQHLLF